MKSLTLHVKSYYVTTLLVFVMFLAYRFERCSVRYVFAELPAMLESKIG